MRAVVRKWGNDLGVHIPAALAERNHIVEGSMVEIVETEGRVEIHPYTEPTLEGLLKQVRREDRPDLEEWGSSNSSR